MNRRFEKKRMVANFVEMENNACPRSENHQSGRVRRHLQREIQLSLIAGAATARAVIAFNIPILEESLAKIYHGFNTASLTISVE
jgi:hypothetical protein